MATPFFLALMLTPTWQQPAPTAADFTLDVEIREALEGGPLVARLILTNKSALPVTLKWSYRSVNHSYAVPKSWRFAPVSPEGFVFIGVEETFLDLKAKAQFEEISYLHHTHAIPAGDAVVTFSWPVYLRKGNEQQPNPQPAAKPGDPIKIEVVREGAGKAKPDFVITKKVPIHIRPANAENVAKLARRLMSELDQPNGSAAAREHVAKLITNSTHKSLEPLAWRVLESDLSRYQKRMLVLIEEAYKTDVLRNQEFIKKVVEDRKPAHTFHIFCYWRWNGTPLPEKDLDRLRTHKSLWVRAYALSVFPKKFADTEKRDILGALTKLPAPLAEIDFDKLFKQMNSGNFAVRQAADKKMEQLGIEAEPALRRRLQENQSNEVRQRCQRILDVWQPAYEASNSRMILEFLRRHNHPLENEMLDALRSGPEASWTTKDARRGVKTVLPKR